jgi:RNA 3'-terminal phosphate cyclase (ATP)
MVNIRAKREKPGLMRQNLTAVGAATEVCGAAVIGDEVGSGEITFRPGIVKPGNYSFSIGTAGSCTLVLQTVLPLSNFPG